jgi:hypothetical protein
MTRPAKSLSVPAVRFMVSSTLDTLGGNPLADATDRRIQHQAAIEALTALKPRDANEANLAAGAVTAHHAAMDCFRRAALPNMTETVAMRILGRAVTLARMAEHLQNALARNKAANKNVAQTTALAELAPALAEAVPARLAAASGNRPERHTAAAARPAATAAKEPAQRSAAGRQGPTPATTRKQLLSSTARPTAIRAVT